MMTVELDWREGDEQPEVTWETEGEPLPFGPEKPRIVASKERARGPRLAAPVRLLLIVAGLLLLGGAIIAGVVLLRANQGNELARQDIRAAASKLLEARLSQDLAAYASLLDPLDSVWKERQLLAFSQSIGSVPTAIEVIAVELNGDQQAVAQVVERRADGSSWRKLIFFRRTPGDPQWRQAPPWPEAFGAASNVDTPHFRIEYRQRDSGHLGTLTNLAEGAFVTLCGELRCQPSNRPMILQILYTAGSLPEQNWGDLVIPSPWTVGIGGAGQFDSALQRALVEQLAWRLAAAKQPAASSALLQAISDQAAESLTGAPLPGAKALFDARQADALLPLEQAWRAVAINNTASNELAMAQVSSLLAFAQDAFSSDALGRLLEGMDRQQELAELLPRALNISLPAFQEAWLSWLPA